MIIRPATGIGNKVIVQDQAGASVLTTADSGATIANATLDNATQDNITRLGTVTTGTMNNTIGSSATFPAGHIIQVVTNTGDASGISTSGNTYATINVYGSITPKFVGSKIYVHSVFNLGVLVTSSAGSSVTSNIYRSGSSVTDAYIEQDGYDLYYEAAPRTSNAQWAGRNPIAWYDTPGHSNTTDAITYTVHGKGGQGSGCHVQFHKSHGKWTFLMMEIMQ